MYLLFHLKLFFISFRNFDKNIVKGYNILFFVNPSIYFVLICNHPCICTNLTRGN